MSWVDRYKKVMLRTRWVSVAGATLVLIGVVREVSAALIAFSMAENIGIDAVVEALILPFLIGVAFVVRILALRSAERPYYQLTASWLICVCTAAFYIWWTHLPGSDGSVCNGEGVCFGVYDIARTSWVGDVAVFFLVLSIVRSTITMLYAAFRPEYR